MPQMTEKKTAQAKAGSRLRNMAISVLATPFNLLFIGLRIIWSGRRLRLAALAHQYPCR